MYDNLDTSDSTNPYIQDPYQLTGNLRDAEKKGGCFGTIVCIIVTVIVFAVVSLLSSCSTTKESSFVEHHKIESLMDRMDSLMHTKTVIQQDSAWRETILHQFQSIREKSDTSHTVVVDSVGNIIKERIVINNTRETISETDRQEREVMMHRLEVMDSTLNVMRQQIEHSDSLLQAKETTVIKQVANPLSWWQNARIWLGNIVLIALAIAAAVWIWKKKTWWLNLLRKK